MGIQDIRRSIAVVHSPAISLYLSLGVSQANPEPVSEKRNMYGK